MADALLFDVAAVAVMAGAVALVVLRKHNFVLVSTIAMFAVVGIEVVRGAMGPSPCALFDLGWRYTDVFDPLHWWRLATHLFVHDACRPAHIVGNAFTFLLLGFPLEQKVGWKVTMALFFLTGVVGALLSSAFVLATQDPLWVNAVGIGASGSIFGVIGYFAVRYPREQVLAPLVVIIARVPVYVAAVAALFVQAVILLEVQNPLIASLPWPSVLAHVSSFVVGMAATRAPWFRAEHSPVERAASLDFSPLRDLAAKPAEKMEVEGIIKEDIPEVALAKLESFVKRARCPKCQGALELKGRKLASDCGWSVEFSRRAPPAARK